MRGSVLIALLMVAGASEAGAQDVAAGEKVFGVCKACHQIGETAKNNVGPVLNGVIGRKAGSVPGYVYSAANKDSGITWDEATLREYIKDPKAKVPGTKMIYAGLKDEQKTNDLVAFLKQFDADGKKKWQSTFGSSDLRGSSTAVPIPRPRHPTDERTLAWRSASGPRADYH
jgi:cytochrome c